jgi:hypothetical protein
LIICITIRPRLLMSFDSEPSAAMKSEFLYVLTK